MKKNGKDIKLPPVESSAHLVRWITELGFFKAEGMGAMSCIDYKEIQSWSMLKKIELTPQEVDILRLLSSCFCSQYRQDGLDVPAPWQAEYSQEEFSSLQESIRKARRLRLAGNKKPSR